MFRFISAWLQVVLRYIAAWLQAAAAAAAAAADKLDAASLSLQGTAAMDFPATVSLGPLHRQLHSFRAATNNLPDGVSDGEVRRLEEDLETLFTELKIVSEADDPSFTARCWMKEVRELRYDAEDFFNEVPRSSAGAGRSALHTLILSIPRKLKLRRQVAEAFSDLCARAKDASQRRQSFQLGPATIRPESGQVNVSRSKSLGLIGLEESMDKLVKLMALDDQEIAELLAFDSEDTEQLVQVVPIFGSAGVGKTTLARTFYRNFGGKFQCRAFVRVSRNPDMRRMLSSMLSQIKAPPVHGFPDVQDLIDHIRGYLQCKRYLIVIDDLWASSTWDIISRAFPDGDCCCRIIVTTEIKDVALACSRYQFKYMYEMSPLNGDQSRQLFLGRVFGSENGCPPDFKEVTYEIIRKCGGLPLATENIASMLACELNIDQWKHIRDSLPSVLRLRTDPSSEGLKEVLNIIYDNLSPYLKTCLLYLIMYPEGSTISKDELVTQWITEDFIGEGQDREKIARHYFDELVSRGMIQPLDRNYNDEVLTCTVHHMVLDLIRYKSLEENFIIIVSCFQTITGLPDKVRRLSVQFGGAKCANIPADFMMTQVRSLIFFGFLNCVPSFVEYKLLRVLILHIWADQSKIFDLTRISKLFQLRYLKIDCNITVHLPDEIQQLRFLETLELHAPVSDMPSDISCLPLLHTLGYFDLGKNSIENVQSLGELNNLQDLHLTWSNISDPDNLKNNMQCLGSILRKLGNLKSLTLVRAASSHADVTLIRAASSHPDVLDDAGGAILGISGDVLSSVSSPPPLLQRLELSGRCCIFASLPEWTKELGNLCILKISVRKLLRKDIDILKGLPALMALSLYVWTAPVGKVVFDSEGFSILKYFKFTCAAPCLAFLIGSMPSVRELKLAFNANRMEQYSQIVAGLEYLIELKEITAKVGGTGADESDKRYAESALRGAIANHPCAPIITVQCVDRILYGEDDMSAVTQEQEHWTLEEEHEIQEESLDPLPELIPIPSTQTQMRDGSQNGGTDSSREVLTQTREEVQDELIERSMEVLTHEREHLTLERQHEIHEELLDPLPEVVSTSSTQTQVREEVRDGEIGRSMEVLTQEQEQCIVEQQDEMTDGVLDVQIGTLMEVLAQEEQWRNNMQNSGIGRSMAVVSASHGTLDPLLDKLNALLSEEYGNLEGVLHEVSALKSELTLMHTAVRKYTMLEDPDVQVKLWLSLLREFSYDAEDYIDKFIHQLDNGGHHGGFKQIFGKTACQLKTLGSQHEIAEKIDELKDRAKNLKASSYKMDDTACITSCHSTVDPQLAALFVDSAHLVGIDSPRDDLAKWTVEVGNSSAKHHCRMLSIVGFGGLGKTTLANEVYRKAKGHFHCQAFVSVSQKPDIKKILMNLISQVSPHGFTKDTYNWDKMRFIRELRKLLKDKRYLVVIDDIWSISAWNIIKCAFPENNCSSRVITTTRIIEVARSCCMGQDDRMYEMQPLSDFHSKRLFLRRIFGSKDSPDMLKEVSNEILKKCGGLPLAIISVSSLLANRPANKEEWEKVCALDKDIGLEEMNRILCLSYNALPDNLKTCLLYLSNFPEGCVIERERLVRRWIAEGFISENHGQSQQEVAEWYFYEFINRSMIQAVDIRYDGKARACRVHNMMLELIISKSAEDNFVMVIRSRQTGLVNRHGCIRRLSVQHIDQNLASVLANEDLSHVRSLTVTSSSCIEHLPSLACFENLRVLDFEGCDGLEKYHMKGLGKFFQLKYLSLRGTWISHLPSEVVMLHNLETLDIRETHVEELPAEIVHLTKLQHLIASTDYVMPGIKIPDGIGNMRNLQVLLGCGISSGSVGALEELGNLTNLNELDVQYWGIGSEYKWHEDRFLSSLIKLGSCKLQSFRIWRKCPGDVKFLESWFPLPFSLQRFEMSGCYSFKWIPCWISPALTSLAYLEINIVEVTQTDLCILGEMPALLHLRLTCRTFRKERLIFYGRGFQHLKEFVYDAAVLPSGNLLFMEGALPMLEDLSLIYCVSMVNAYGFFLGIEHLPRLKNAQIHLYKQGAASSDIASAEVTIRNEADDNPNCPRVTLVEHVKREDYCSDGCPNRTVTDQGLDANTTNQKVLIIFFTKF
ncbi:uncharacterized protein LOC119331959 isoform X2 [Triticum dicoccoides]|uniref:uncharacterized protein n=1 Tax=Triticum aestivum TaxID=4565 RepID=UPI0018916A19|nr:uncharacterized protein LOC119331959 isoform X2 [Triticum dicoccoides]XP_044426688.1 uncharacterized protein LOC123150953 [Triticum aestivum]